MITYDQIKKYASAGLCIVPTHIGEKRPALIKWTNFQKERPTSEQLQEWFAPEANRDGMGIICGQISGGLEVIDFDKQGQEFPFWADAVKKRLPELYSKLVIERSCSGGKHVYYKCEYISGAMNLAMETKNKKLIETRGEGGFIKCAPSEGYELEQGDFDSIPVITIDEREFLISAARCRNQYVEEDKTEYMQNIPVTGERTTAAEDGTLRPGDDFNVRGNFRELLESLGWKPEKGTGADGNQHWTRPGKKKGTSATLKNIGGVELFYIFTSSTDLDNYKAYTPFQFLTLEKFGGNFREAAKWLGGQGFGKKKYSEKSLPETKKIQTATGDDLEISLESIKENPNLRSADTFNEFPLKELPPVCRSFIVDMVAGLEQNPAGLAAFLLAQCGGVLGGSVRLRLNDKGWNKPPILWVCLIGVSGAGKSPTLQATEMLVSNINNKFNDEYEAAYSKYLTDYNDWWKNRKKEPDVPEPIAPKKRKVFLTDATFEGLIKDITISKCRTYFELDEFVTFFNMINRNKTPGEAGKWLSGYNGASISTSRAGAKEVYINEAYWAMLGGSTPEKFRNYILNDGGDKDGTLTRISLVWAPMLSEYIEEEENPEIETHIEEMRNVVELLVKSKPAEDKYGNEKKYTELYLSPEAEEDWKQMRRENFYAVRNPANASDAVSGYLAKSLELTPRIAIILHCIEAAHNFNLNGVAEDVTGLGAETHDPEYFQFPLEVSLETWRSARIIAEWFTTENLICYELFRFTEPKSEIVQASEILMTISKSPEGCTLRDLYRVHRKYRSPKGKEELGKILTFLLEKGKIETEESQGSRGRTKIIFKSK